MSEKGFFKRVTAAALTAFMLTGCSGVDKNAAVVTINNGEDTTSYEYANFVAHYKQAEYDSYYRAYFGDGYWSSDMSGEGTTMEDTVKDQVMTEMEDAYLAVSHASDYGVALSDEDKKKITETAEAFMSSNSEEAIKQVGASQEVVEQYLTNCKMGQMVKDAAAAAADVEVTEEESAQATVMYTLFETTEFAPVGDGAEAQVNKSDEDIAEARAHAEAIANGKGTFEDDVTAEEGTVNTYSFTKAEDPKEDPQMQPEFIEAALKLKNGERSGVVEIDDIGIFVIEMVDANDKEATATKAAELKQEKAGEVLADKVTEWKDATDWKVDEKLWAKVRFIELFETALSTGEGETEE